MQFPSGRALQFFLVILFSLSLSEYTYCQEEDGDEFPLIYSVKIVGIHVTNRNLIIREMELKSGMRADPKIIESDRLHILSLGIFNQVEISVVTDLGRAVLLVRVTERFYIYPYPILQYDPTDPSKRVYGLIISHYNFRGYAERLSLGWWDGYQRGLSLLHRDPWFSIRGKYALRTQVYFNDSEISAPDGIAYRAKTESILARLRRRIDRDRWVGIEAEWEERSSSGAFYTIMADGRDRLIAGRLYYEADLRDYIYYPSSGYYFSAILKANKMIDTTHSFFRQEADLRLYKSINRFTLGLRGYCQITENKIPWYRQPELTQFEVRSRTPWGRKGESNFAINIEIRFNIMPIRYYSFGGIPIAGRYLQKLKFSVEGLLFADRGLLKTDNPIAYSGYSAVGAGLQFQLPYIEAAHVLYGWDPDNFSANPVLILRTGVTF